MTPEFGPPRPFEDFADYAIRQLDQFNARQTHRCARRAAGLRLHVPDPEDPCGRCEGCGFVRWFDADCGWTHEACGACAGVATVGVFVIRLHVGRLQFEHTWETEDFAAALARATRWAALLRVFCRRVAVPGSEVRVSYLHDPTTAEAEIVQAVQVWPAGPMEAA